jgi:undecaprenyl-diphosphatase
MLNEIIYSIIQAATEFLPISSDGHLAIASNLLGVPNLFFITFLHLASLLAVIIFTRKEIVDILRFNKESWKLIFYIIFGIVPAVIFGLFFNNFIESTLTSYFLISVFFIFSGLVVFSTKYFQNLKNNLDKKSVFSIGLMQALALLPGVSRSGMTISTGLFFGIEKEKAVKFSFLMFIPLSIGAFLFEFIKYPGAIANIPILTLIFSFVLCFVLSLLFLNILNYLVKTAKFWIFGLYCIILGILILIFF